MKRQWYEEEALWEEFRNTDPIDDLREEFGADFPTAAQSLLIEKSIRETPGTPDRVDDLRKYPQALTLIIKHGQGSNTKGGAVRQEVWDKAKRHGIWEQAAWKWDEAAALSPVDFEVYKSFFRDAARIRATREH